MKTVTHITKEIVDGTDSYGTVAITEATELETEMSKPTPFSHPWFVRKWYTTVRTYIGNQRDVNTSYATEAEARAAYDAPRERYQNEAVLFLWVDIGTPEQRYVQVDRKKTPKL